jgi:hypothetical protein
MLTGMQGTKLRQILSAQAKVQREVVCGDKAANSPPFLEANGVGMLQLTLGVSKQRHSHDTWPRLSACVSSRWGASFFFFSDSSHTAILHTARGVIRHDRYRILVEWSGQAASPDGVHHHQVAEHPPSCTLYQLRGIFITKSPPGIMWGLVSQRGTGVFLEVDFNNIN